MLKVLKASSFVKLSANHKAVRPQASTDKFHNQTFMPQNLCHNYFEVLAMENDIVKEITFNLFPDNDFFMDSCLRHSDGHFQRNDLKDDFQSQNNDADENAPCMANFECIEYLSLGQDLSSIVSGDGDNFPELNFTANIAEFSQTHTSSKTVDWNFEVESLFLDSFNETCDNLDLIEPSFETLDPTTLADYSQIFNHAGVADVRKENPNDFSTISTTDTDCEIDCHLSLSYDEETYTCLPDDVMESLVFEESLDNSKNDKFEYQLSYIPNSSQSVEFYSDPSSKNEAQISTSCFQNISARSSSDAFTDFTPEIKEFQELGAEGQVPDYYPIATSSPSQLDDDFFLSECARGQEMFDTSSGSTTGTILISSGDNAATAESSFIPNNWITNGEIVEKSEIAHYNTQVMMRENSDESGKSDLKFSFSGCTNMSGKNRDNHSYNSPEKSLVDGAIVLSQQGGSTNPCSSWNIGNAEQLSFYNVDTGTSSVYSLNDQDSNLTNSAAGKTCNDSKSGSLSSYFVDTSEKCICPRVNVGIEDNFISIRVKDILYKNIKDVMGFFKKDEKKNEKQIRREWNENRRLVKERKQKRLKKDNALLTLQ